MSAISENKQGLKVLIAGAILQLFLGIIYVWSVFKAPVSAYYGWDPASVGLTASFMLCFFVIGILVGGQVQMKIGVRMTALAGGLMVAVGMFATAMIPSAATLDGGDAAARAPVFLIYILYGVIGGFGVGAGYNAALSTAQKWFPKNRGLATGVSVGAFGFSTVVFAPLVETLIKDYGVQSAFMILAGIFATAVLSLFWFIKTPDGAAAAAAPALKGKQYTTTEMIKTGRYYLVTLSLMMGTSVFFILNPDLKDLALTRGAAQFATGLVMLTGIANALGRICVPMMSDKIGRESAGIAILVATALGAFGLCFAQGFLLIAIIAVAAFCFGGYSGLYPVVTSENFGLKNIGANYGAVMVGFMVSALLFPIVINRIDDQALRFTALGVVGLVGTAAMIALKVVNSKGKN